MSKLKIVQRLMITTISVLGLVACGSSADSASGFIESGKALLAEGKPEKARLEFKNAIQVDPKVVESYYQIALLDEKAKSWKAMFANLSKVEQLDAKHHDAVIRLGQLYLLSGELDQALERANKVIKQNDQKAMAWVLRASVELKQENYGAAIKDVNQAIQLDANNIEALSLKAIVLNKQGKTAESLALLSTVLSNNPDELPLTMIKLSILEQQKDYPAMELMYKDLQQKFATETWVHVSLAKLYNVQNRYEDAKQVLQQFVTAQPDKNEAKMLLVSLVQAKEPELAITLLDTYIKQQPKDSELRFAKTKLLLASKQVDAAVHELQQIAKLPDADENANKATIMLAGFDLQQGKKEQANQKVQEVLDNSPENEAALLLKARIDIANKNIDTAVTNLRVVLRNNPESDQALVLLAQAYIRSGSTELAEDNFRQALEANPSNTVAALSVAQGLMKNKDLNRTEKVLLNALNSNPNNAAVLQALAQVRLLKKDWLGTQSILDTLLQKGDNSTAASYLTARLAQAQNQYAEAIAEYKKVLADHPEMTRALQGLAFSHVKLDRKAELISYLQQFNVDNPDKLAGYAILSNVYANDKAWDKSIAVLEDGLAIKPTWQGGYSALAKVYTAQKNVGKAFDSYQRGLAANPGSNFLAMQLASMNEQKGNFKEAKILYEGVLGRDNNIDAAANNLASLLTDQFRSADNLKKAQVLAKRFEKSTEPYFMDTYAWVNVQLGQLEEAELVLLKVVVKAPDVAVFNYHLGALYSKQNKVAEAKGYLERAKQQAYKQGDGVLAEKIQELL